MNRSERRRRIKEYAKYRESEMCPLCKHKSLFVSVPTGEKTCDIRCEICNGVVLRNCKNSIPMTYVNLKSVMEENENDK